MRILSIETSCDETAISVIDAKGTLEKPRFTMLGNALFSQVALHAKYGGVMPNLAKREHAKNLPILLEQVLKEATLWKYLKNKSPLSKQQLRGIHTALVREDECAQHIITIGESIKIPPIDAIAVTYGPGLEPALWVGITVAKALSCMWNIPLIPVNHMEGHIVSVLISKQKKTVPSLSYPILSLLISGGHTELVLSKSPLSYKTIGATRDDALGECYDKVARMMNLPYPGGPEVSRLAEVARRNGYKKTTWNLPRPMIYTKDFDFSFSGLKTAVLYKIRDHGTLTPKDKRELSKEFEDAITDVIIHKTKKALLEHGAKHLIIGGGVIANSFIRNSFIELCKEISVTLHIPDIDMATDNSIMIGIAGFLRATKNPKILRSKKKIVAEGNAFLS